jgi:hypothetical protein
MSLPLAFNTQLDNIPSPKAYLFANAGKVAEWASRLGPKTKTRVGLAWSGNPDHANDHNRSLALEELLNSLPTGFEYVSLHKEVLEKDKPILENYQVQHYGAMLHDFTETAALCENMDLVITVDTSIAHLAGAMGKVTWVLLPYAPDWRWMLGRSNSPWYPSVRLFRQDKLRQWSVVLKNIALELS